MLLFGILLALGNVVLFSLGAQLQHAGVREETSTGFNLRHFLNLLRQPRWLTGGLLLVLATLMNLGALTLAPIVVVQPIGALAVVMTAMMQTRKHHLGVHRDLIRAISISLIGVAIFVTVAGFATVNRPVTEQALTVLLCLLAAFLTVLLICWMLPGTSPALLFVTAGGISNSFTALLTKTLLSNLTGQTHTWFFLLCVPALLVTFPLGAYLIQKSYSLVPPDLVLAGLTVVDPLLTVLLGVFVLGELRLVNLPVALALTVSGTIAAAGVILLAKHYGQELTAWQQPAAD